MMRLMGATSMNADRKKRLEATGFKFGTVGELFNLSEAEELLVEVKVALAEAIRELREVRSLSPADLARLTRQKASANRPTLQEVSDSCCCRAEVDRARLRMWSI